MNISAAQVAVAEQVPPLLEILDAIWTYVEAERLRMPETLVAETYHPEVTHRADDVRKESLA